MNQGDTEAVSVLRVCGASVADFSMPRELNAYTTGLDIPVVHTEITTQACDLRELRSLRESASRSNCSVLI